MAFPAAPDAPLRDALLFVPDPARALERVAGLPLALRAALALQKEGFERVALLAPSGEAPRLARLLSADARLKLEVHPLDPEALLAALGEAASTEGAEGNLEAETRALEPRLGFRRALFTTASRVSSPEVFRALCRRAEEKGDGRTHHALASGEPACALVAPAGLVARLLRGEPLPELLGEPLDVPGAFSVDATTPEGKKRATYHLFEACRKPVDGIVSRHLNRHVSIWISKRLVGTPVTPNMMSALTFSLGVLGALAAARGGYAPMLLGAFLFQWNSILDGVDGELARVRYQHSHLGQWLDTVSDDASNVIFYAGMAFGARKMGFPPVFFWAGILASAATVIGVAQYYVELWRLGSGDFYALEWDFEETAKKGAVGRAIDKLRWLFKKDFFIFAFFVLALFGLLPYALFIAAAGAVTMCVAATTRNLGRLAGKR